MSQVEAQEQIMAIKRDEQWRPPTEEDGELAAFIARTSMGNNKAVILHTDLESASNILTWELMARYAAQRRQELFQVGLTTEAAAGLMYRFEQQGVEVQDEEYIGTGLLPIPVELTSDAD